MARLVVAIIVLVVIATGCDRQESKEEGLSLADIAWTQGMMWWRIQLPQDLGPKDSVCLAYKHPDGTVEDRGGGGGFKPGEVIKVVVWQHGITDDLLAYSLIGNKAKIRTSSKARPRRSYSICGQVTPNGQLIKPDVPLFKWGKEEIGLFPSGVQKGEVALIVHIEREGVGNARPSGE